MTQLLDNETEQFIDQSRIPEPCVLVIFGATGDLTSRKLFPALYNLTREKLIPPNMVCVGFARRDKSHDDFRKEMKAGIEKFSRSPIDPKIWDEYQKHIFYHRSEFDDDKGYDSLKNFLDNIDKQFGTKGNRVYYLSTPPSYFPLIVEQLSKHQLIYDIDEVKDKWSRVIIEKPFGRDLESAIQLQKELTSHLDENQIYRIDHYLGKETVQNLLFFRFGNPIFENIWNNHHIDSVQITVAEEQGIGTRGKFWEEAGMLRDIVQNHMMQLLSLIAMEPPTNLKSSSIHDEKVKVLESIRPFPNAQIDKYAVRGQYGKGKVDGVDVKAYREEENVNPKSEVETYVALHTFIDNWRWSGVPFYLRAGKRLTKRLTEIAVYFKQVPGDILLQADGKKIATNVLVIRIQPDEGISLLINCKVPGLTAQIKPVKMDFSYASYFGSTPPEAYERLICDCMIGDNTLFARIDEVLSSWELLNPVLETWINTCPVHFPNYASGSWGPVEADKMLARDGRQWRNV